MGRLESIPFSNLEYTIIIVRVTGADYSVTEKLCLQKYLSLINAIVTATGQLHESSYLYLVN